jgi:hypothetical protein
MEYTKKTGEKTLGSKLKGVRLDGIDYEMWCVFIVEDLLGLKFGWNRLRKVVRKYSGVSVREEVWME